MFCEYVSIRKALRAQQGAHESRRSFAEVIRYFYNAGSAGLVERAWHPTCKGVEDHGFCDIVL